MVPELIPVLGSQPAGDVCYDPDEHYVYNNEAVQDNYVYNVG